MLLTTLRNIRNIIWYRMQSYVLTTKTYHNLRHIISFSCNWRLVPSLLAMKDGQQAIFAVMDTDNLKWWLHLIRCWLGTQLYIVISCVLQAHNITLWWYLTCYMINNNLIRQCLRLQLFCVWFKEMEHVQNIFISFDKYLFLEVINILI